MVSASILTSSKDAFTTDWNSFLSKIGVTSTTADPSTGRLTCTSSSTSSLFGCVFDTDENSDILHIPTSSLPDANTVVLALAEFVGPAGTKTSFRFPDLKLLDLLKAIGLADATGAIPNDDGEISAIASAAGGASPSALFQSVLDKIGISNIIKPDTRQPRNALWLSPGVSPRIDVARTYTLDSTVADADKHSLIGDAIIKIQEHFGITIPSGAKSHAFDLRFIVQQTWLGVESQVVGEKGDVTSTWKVSETYSFLVQLLVDGYVFSVGFDPAGMHFSFINPQSTSILTMLNLDTDLSDSSFSDTLKSPSVLRVSGARSSSGTVSWGILLSLKFNQVPMYLRYDSESKSLAGGLIKTDFYSTAAEAALVSYDPSTIVEKPADSPEPQDFYDVIMFGGEFGRLPGCLPTRMLTATIAYQITPTLFSLQATLTSSRGDLMSSSSEPMVPSPFSWDKLDVSMTKVGATLSCRMDTTFSLTDGTSFADLGLTVSYVDSDWKVLGHASNVKGTMLTQFFDKAYQDALNAVVGRLQIDELQMLYAYGKDDSKKTLATSFIVFGTVSLGKLQLRLFFQYASSRAGETPAAASILPPATGTASSHPAFSDTKVRPLSVVKTTGGTHQTDWKFECDLGAVTDADVTLGNVLESIVDGGADSLPSFLANVKIPPATSDKSLFSLEAFKAPAGADTGSVIFKFSITLEGFTFAFRQIGSTGKVPAKQVLSFSIDTIPLMKNIPVIGSLPQPFDALGYMWVNKAGGITQKEADMLALSYRQPQGQPAQKDRPGQPAKMGTPAAPLKAASALIVLTPGHHFIVMHNNQVIIDHVFAASGTSVKRSSGKGTVMRSGNNGSKNLNVSGTDNTDNNNTSTDEPPSNPPTKGTVGISLGPLSIDSVALQYKENGTAKMVGITMNASFAMGPLSFELIGFGFEVPLTTITLHDFGSLTKLQPVIAGMALGFSKPPLTIAGGFEHDTIGTGADLQEIYLGGIGVSWPPYTFVGVGEYAILHDYKSVFIYAKLDGPLITFEFATISGMRLGFGYNSMVRSPGIDELTSFPFINDSESAGSNPLDIVKHMTQSTPPWVSPKANSYWLAAGMSISAFDVLTVTALALLSFRDGGIIISLYADAVAQMPPAVTDKSEMIVYVEIAMVAELNPIDGYFRVEAALAPTSFLLVQDCHLYGGFAFVYWFGSNPHAGDWVFSVGGYHPAYQRPEWYPNPQRLGISWSPGSCMSVTGESYFAVTPKTVMGGATLRVTLSVGPISAWLDASFDCLINFHPLHYRADFHVSVGVAFDADILFIHIHIECHVGAWLTVQGPDFGGTAHVDFDLFAFDVDFGASPQAKAPLNLLEFWSMLHKPGPEVASGDDLLDTRVKPCIMFDEKVFVPPPPPAKPDPNVPLPKASVMGRISDDENGSAYEGAAFKHVLEDGNFPMPKRTPDTNQIDPTTKAENFGAGAMWYVKGGTFKFRIATDMAVSHASISGSATDPKEGPIELEAPTKFFSRPMRLDQAITSIVKVDIYIQVPVTKSDPTGKRFIGGWQNVAFDIKAVPQATFGPPSTGATSDLLSPENATLPLAMGLKLEAPPPRLADPTLPVFKASSMSELEVGDFRFRTPDITQYAGFYLPQFKPLAQPDFTKEATKDRAAQTSVDNVLTPTQTLYVPAELTQTQQDQTLQVAWDEVGDQWIESAAAAGATGAIEAIAAAKVIAEAAKAAKAVKVAAGTNAAASKTNAVASSTGSAGAAPAAAALVSIVIPNRVDEMVKQVADIFGWQAGLGTKLAAAGNAVPTTGQRQPWELTGAFPNKLVRSRDGKTKNLEATYLDLPMIAVV